MKLHVNLMNDINLDGALTIFDDVCPRLWIKRRSPAAQYGQMP